MLLSILVPALDRRDWHKIVADLKDQRAKAGLTDDVEILIDVDDGSAHSGVKRQRMMNVAKGEYVAFVDDDDRLNPLYLFSLAYGIRQDQPDVVTFNLELFNPAKPRYKQTEVWQYGLYANDRRRGLMCANHLCAWRADLARRVGWCPNLGYADDQLWYQPLFASGLVKTEHHVDRILYQYDFNPSQTANQAPGRREAALKYVGRGLRCFRGPSDGIYIEDGTQPSRAPEIRVYGPSGQVQVKPASDLRHFHTITIG